MPAEQASPDQAKAKAAQIKAQMKAQDKENEELVKALSSSKRTLFHQQPPISWHPTQPTPAIWKNGAITLLQPGAGETSKPFFLQLREPNGLIVLKFMECGSASSYYFGDRILKQLGARTPAFRFLKPDDAEVAEIRNCVGNLFESEVTFSDGAKIEKYTDRFSKKIMWRLSKGKFSVFGNTIAIEQAKGGFEEIELVMAHLKSLAHKPFKYEHTLNAAGDRVASIHCRATLSQDEEAFFTNPRYGWQQKLKELDEGKVECIMVFEYVKGSRLDDAFTAKQPTPAEAEAVFQKVGETLVADLILNNSDRFRLPGVWDSDEGNAGNVMLTTDWKLISIDHEIDDTNESNHAVVNKKMEAFLDDLPAIDRDGFLPQLAELLNALKVTRERLGDELYDAAAQALVQGVVRGVFLVGNYPRLWFPNSEPGLFEYLEKWRSELETGQYSYLERVGEPAWKALQDRVAFVHQRTYPLLLVNKTLDTHTILGQLLHSRPEGVEVIQPEEVHKIEMVASTPLKPVRKFADRFLRLPRSSGSMENLKERAARNSVRLTERLGPFDLCRVGLIDDSACKEIRVHIDSDQGRRFTIPIAIKDSGVGTLQGRLSKTAPLRIDLKAMERAGLPSSAKKFAFAYPVEAEVLPEECSNELRTFLSVGGYMYWDAEDQICGLCILKDGLNIHFSHPRLLQRQHPKVREELYKSNRACRPTIPAFVDAGVVGFSWISPDENVAGYNGKELWPRGAFAYFYADGAEAFDCYYAITNFEPPRLGARSRTRVCIDESASDGILLSQGITPLRSITPLRIDPAATPSSAHTAATPSSPELAHPVLSSENVKESLAQLLDEKLAQLQKKLDPLPWERKLGSLEKQVEALHSTVKAYALLCAASIGALIAIFVSWGRSAL